MRIGFKKINVKKLWLILYTFFAIFEPPFLPVSSIYITGFLTIVLIAIEHKAQLPIEVLKSSNIYTVFKIVFLMLCQLIIVGLIDTFFIENVDLISNRLRCVNQLVILTSIQLLNIYYILLQAKKYEYSLKNLFEILFYAAVIQGLLALTAYLIPGIRSYFLSNMSDVFNSEWTLQRRGYGFSQVLLDTFGYGMALVGGDLLIVLTKNKLKKAIFLALILFAIFMNARTGIIVFSIAVIVYLLKSNKLEIGLIKIAFTAAILIIGYLYIIPFIINYGMNSNSYTIQWIVDPINEIYGIISGNSDMTNLESLTFVSHIIEFPSNVFQLIFGTGHSVYGTSNILGFSTDIGYYNMIWIYGFIGTLLWYSLMIYLFVKAFRATPSINYKAICIFCLISYFIVQVKANLLGYNPGTFVTYFTIFVLIYYGKHPELER